MVEHQSAAISHHFADAAQDHSGGEEPGAPSQTLRDVDQHADAEEGEEGCIRGWTGTVVVHAVFDGAELERAVRERAIGDEVGWIAWIHGR